MTETKGLVKQLLEFAAEVPFGLSDTARARLDEEARNRPPPADEPVWPPCGHERWDLALVWRIEPRSAYELQAVADTAQCRVCDLVVVLPDWRRYEELLTRYVS